MPLYTGFFHRQFETRLRLPELTSFITQSPAEINIVDPQISHSTPQYQIYCWVLRFISRPFQGCIAWAGFLDFDKSPFT